ncbi:MAG: DUF4386 family protein [Chloroflexi bacterium]|nr:DUF4386 family protein [Chloroflexota bacterium]
MMSSFPKMGGVAALVQAATFVVGGALFLGVLGSAGFYDAGIDPVQKVAILADNQAVAMVGYLTAFVAWGVFQVVLALALYERLKTGASGLAQTGAAIGLILAGVGIVYGMIAIVGIESVVGLQSADPERAGTVWLGVESIELTKNEILSGLWLLLVSWAALRVHELSKVLNAFGVVLGVLGILTVIPVFDVLVYAFGPGIIVWYVWLGILMLRSLPRHESRKPAVL